MPDKRVTERPDVVLLTGVSRYLGGRVDTMLSLAMDLMLAFPSLLLAIVVVAALGPGLRNTALAIGITDIGPWVFFINAAMIAPALPLAWLRWFWWRFNVWGEVFGILISVPLSIVVWFVMGWKDRPAWQPTLLLLGVGLFGSVLVSLLTRPILGRDGPLPMYMATWLTRP